MTPMTIEREFGYYHVRFRGAFGGKDEPEQIAFWGAEYSDDPSWWLAGSEIPCDEEPAWVGSLVLAAKVPGGHV